MTACKMFSNNKWTSFLKITELDLFLHLVLSIKTSVARRETIILTLEESTPILLQLGHWTQTLQLFCSNKVPWLSICFTDRFFFSV